jgi:hypothetical protein
VEKLSGVRSVEEVIKMFMSEEDHRNDK